MDRLEDDHYAAAHWSGRPSRRRRSGPERRAQAAAAAAGEMTPGAWLSLTLGVAAVAVVGAFVRWSAWWPHSDNRQRGVTIVGTVAAAIGAALLIKALSVATWRTRVWMLLAAGAAAAVGLTAGYALMVGATAWAK